MKSVIYETKGRAREFCELAINLYTGCAHRCVYCYGADVTHQSKEQFEHQIKPRVTSSDIHRSAYKYSLKNERRPVLMCFITDPYQPLDAATLLTRFAIKALHANNLHFTVLTKAGPLAQRDFSLYEDGDSFATTLTCLNDDETKKWEPNAGMFAERIDNLACAHAMGIPTWVSLEPVIDPVASLAIIQATHKFVDHYKVGKLNYHPHKDTIDWENYGRKALRLINKLGAGGYIKRDLGEYIGYPHGHKIGRQLP